MPRFVANHERHIYAHITHMSTYIRHVPLPCRQTSTQVTRCCYVSSLIAIDISYVAMKRPASATATASIEETDLSSDETDLSSDEGRPDGWLPARQSITGARLFIPARGSGNGKGLIHETWTTEQLLCCLNKWAVLFRTAESDAEMKEDVHYVFTDWQPTNILFQRGKRFPIIGVRIDSASSTSATKILLHVGEVSTSFGGADTTPIEYGTVKRPRLR